MCGTKKNSVGIQHLPDLESVYVATGKGDVILWNTVTEQAREASHPLPLDRTLSC